MIARRTTGAVLLALLTGSAAAQEDFIRGDVNADRALDMSDALYLTKFLFRFSALPCQDAADIDNGGDIDMSDAILFLNYLFLGGVPPAPPGPEAPGPDTFDDPLTCNRYIPVPPPWPARFTLGFDVDRISDPEPGTPWNIDVFATLTTAGNEGPDGAEGWSIGLAIEGGRIGAITLAGLEVSPIGEDAPAVLDLESAGFHYARHAQGGVVSGVVLNLLPPMTLPPVGTQRIARIAVSVDWALTADLTLRYQNGLVGEGPHGPTQPVKNVVSFGGTSQIPFLESVTFHLNHGDPPFNLPADANQDGAIDLSDAVWLLDHLFLGLHPALPCGGGTASSPGPGDLALLDASGDGRIDLADPVRVLSWLFMAGTSPPALGTEFQRVRGCPEGECP